MFLLYKAVLCGKYVLLNCMLAKHDRITRRLQMGTLLLTLVPDEHIFSRRVFSSFLPNIATINGVVFRSTTCDAP